MGEMDKPTRESGVWKPLGGEGATMKASDDDDVEGHKFTLGAQQRVDGDDDVEGHKQQRADEGDDDVEGHKQQQG